MSCGRRTGQSTAEWDLIKFIRYDSIEIIYELYATLLCSYQLLAEYCSSYGQFNCCVSHFIGYVSVSVSAFSFSCSSEFYSNEWCSTYWFVTKRVILWIARSSLASTWYSIFVPCVSINYSVFYSTLLWSITCSVRLKISIDTCVGIIACPMSTLEMWHLRRYERSG